MNLVNELENDLAMAFFVEKDYSTRLNASEVLAIFNSLRESLELTFPDEDNLEERALSAASDSLNH